MTDMPTFIPSILNPSVAVEDKVSLHCMYRGLVMAFCAFSIGEGSFGSIAIILSYMSYERKKIRWQIHNVHVYTWEEERANTQCNWMTTIYTCTREEEDWITSIHHYMYTSGMGHTCVALYEVLK